MGEDSAISNFIERERQQRSGSLIFFGHRMKTLPPEVAELTWLRYLQLSDTHITDLNGVDALTELHEINLDLTHVSDLSPLSGLKKLSVVSFCKSNVTDIRPLALLPKLEEIYCNGCDIAVDAPFLCELPNLRRLCLDPLETGRLGCVPRELLSQRGENCLGRVRSYYRSLNAGTVAVNAAKLFLYGNGEIGKTQIARHLDPPLNGPIYDPKVKTTHGVQVRHFIVPADPVKSEAESMPLTLRLWDFGGQDLYHGAHALFLRDRAIHLIAWTPDGETGQRQDIYGYVSTNQPLIYWLAFARGVSGKHSALIVAQTKTDRPEETRHWTPSEEAELSTGFDGFIRFIATSAKTGFGIDALKAAVREAARWSVASSGHALIATSWASVSAELNRIRSEDLALTSEARRHRVLTEIQFEQIARRCGVEKDFETILYYLNATGEVFWDRTLFPGRIIIDQAWALDAIYALFDRAACIGRLRASRGRFTARELGEWLWNECGHSATDQKLFIGFMLSCRICFSYCEQGGETTYIAPDALPSYELVKDTLALGWDEQWSTMEAIYNYELLHDGLLRGIMVALGSDARLKATYWRGGLQLYDVTTRTRLRLTQKKGEHWAGAIHVKVQCAPGDLDANPDWLAGRIGKLIEDEERLNGLKALGVRPQFKRTDPIVRADGSIRTAEAGPDPAAKRGFFISYAWGDSTSEGHARAQVVERFCQEAVHRGIKVNVDKNEIRLGDSIASYMDRLAQGDRIFVFLSGKYLRSVNCMTELVSAWRYSNRSWEEFD